MGSYYKHKKKETIDVSYSFRCEQCMKESGTLKATISGMEAEINSNYKTLDVTVQHPVKGTLIFGQNRENKISVSSLL